MTARLSLREKNYKSPIYEIFRIWIITPRITYQEQTSSFITDDIQ